MSEFSDRPFVAGSLVGMRAFAADSLGRLIGPSYNQVFKPGENEAECRKDEADGGWITLGYTAASFTASLSRVQMAYGLDPAAPNASEVGASKPLSVEAVERKPIPEHTLAGVGCKCGFYAYFNGRNDYALRDKTIAAIIEGYGVCTVGTAGFRASKARLLALVEPDHDVPWAQIKRNYPGVPTFEDDEQATAAFPLTLDHLPSPDEDDFWTRSAS